MPNSPVREKSELELTRERNIIERNNLYKTLIQNDPDFADVMKILCSGGDKAANAKLKVRKSTRNDDPSFRCSRSSIPLERRRSARLQNKEPDVDDVNTATNKRKLSDDDYEDLEEVIYRPKKSRKTTNKCSVHHIIPVEAIDEEKIGTIATKTSKKEYSSQGTSCHQCRQKTMDQKTCCRNVDCIGVRGQFCGICLFNRYGENAAQALKDPNWHCPVCRGICNCSFCRTKAGKRPTGILTPMAHQAGHKSVKDFLDSLRGEGDYPHQDNLPRKNEEPNDLLGFSTDGGASYNDFQHEFDVPLNLQKLQEICQKKENELYLLKQNHSDDDDDCPNLLGFYTDSNICLLENNVEYELMSPLFSAMTNIHLDENTKNDVDLTEETELTTEMDSE